MALIKFLFIAIVIYYALKTVVWFLLPGALRNLEKNIRNQNNRYHNNKREGEVTVQGQRKREGSISKDVGEYVEFEELKDKK